MAKNALTLKSALKRKRIQRRRLMSLSVGEKLALLDRLHSNASFLKSFRPKEK